MLFYFFFFKQKTAYEMRISDWSSDVCSSDLNRPKAVRRNGLSDEEYWGSPMLADPLRRLDFCLETDGAVAVVTTTKDRARDCRHKPALIHACAHGGQREWGRAFAWMGMPDPYRSEEHTSELQSLMCISYAVFCLKNKKRRKRT